MGLFSSSSSSSTKNYSEETSTNNVDNRVTDGNSGNIGGNISITAGAGVNDVNISRTDYGALDTASDIADRAFDMSQSAFTSSQQSIKEIAGDAVYVARDITTDNTAKTIQYGIIAAAIVAAVAMYARIK